MDDVNLYLSSTNGTLIVGQTLQATAVPVGLQTGAVATYNWSSSNNAVAVVAGSGSGAVVTAISPGTATLSLQASAKGSGYADAILKARDTTITVAAQLPAITGSVSLSALPTLAPGTVVPLQPSVQKASTQVGVVYTYQISPSGVAAISGNVLTAVAPGTASLLITATGSGAGFATTVITSTIAITVLPPVVASVLVTSASPVLTVGATTQATAVAMTATGQVVLGRSIVWSSTNVAVATAGSSGLVTAVGLGTASINAAVDGIVGSTSVTVTAPQNLLEIVSGNNQLGITGRGHADSLTVRVRTPGGASVPNAGVLWSTPSGSVSSTSTLTDAQGNARVQWTAGTGAATVTASYSGAPPLSFSGTGRVSGACSLAPSATNQRFSLGATDFTQSLNASRPIKIAIIFVDFPGLPASEVPATLVSNIIDPGLVILRELSYNRLNITTTTFPKWYRMSKPIDQYDWTTFLGHKAYVDEAMTVSDPEIDYSSFDALYVFSPPSANKPVSPTLNAGTAFGFGLTHDGKIIGSAVTFGLDSRTYGPTAVAHETGHTLGLLDLYTFDASGTPYTGNQFRYVGAWTLMSNIFNAAHWLMWEKRKLGFIDAAQWDCIEGPGGEEVVIQPNASVSAGLKMAAVKLDANRALVVEVRDKTGLDASLCASGVLIYEVNAAALSGYGPAIVRGSRVSTTGAAYAKCGPWADGVYGVGAGNVTTYTDGASGTTVTVLSAESGGGYRVRVKKQ